MRKKIWILLTIVGVLAFTLVIMFVPLVNVVYKDGGTRERKAFAYKIVEWNVMLDDGYYHETRTYWGKDRFKDTSELWKEESQHVKRYLIATVLEINGDSVLVEPAKGEEELYSSEQISFQNDGKNIGAEVGSVVKITYVGDIIETFPAKINMVDWDITRYKINGLLSKDWCVGDQVQVTYDYAFGNRQEHRREGNLRGIEITQNPMDLR